MEETKFTVTGSGTELAVGYLEEAYKKGLSTKEAVKNVAKALAIAMKRNAATGDGMMIAVINKVRLYWNILERSLKKYLVQSNTLLLKNQQNN